MKPFTLRSRRSVGSAHVPAILVPLKTFRRPLPVVALLVAGLLPAAALAGYVPSPHSSESEIPSGAKGANYAKGYLNLAGYVPAAFAGVQANAGATTDLIQQALDDAYEYKKVLLIPSGTYYINNTLYAYTATGTPNGIGLGYTAGMPRAKHIAIVGSTVGTRPVIRLANSASGFDNGTSEATAKPVVEFKNFKLIPKSTDPDWNTEQAGTAYGQMLRNVDIHCNGKAGAIGLYFNQAEDTSIEDVTITATGSFAGIRGLPARSGAAAVNIIVNGGQYGLDTLGQENPSSTVANIQLLDQTVSAVRHDGFGVLTLVGFKIRKSGMGPALVTVAKNNAHKSEINLIEGIIELDAVPSVAAIDNTNARNFYARKVYVKTTTATAGSNKLVKSGSAVTSSAATQEGSTGRYWVRIKEYGFRRNTGPDSTPETKDSQTLINGTLTTGTASNDPFAIKLEPLVNGVVPTPPANLLTKHGWVRKPFFEDSDAKDLVGLNPSGVITSQSVGAEGLTNYVINATALQTYINNSANKKIFLRAGIYQLSNTITLNADTVLFGADRYLTRIETAPNWRPTSNTLGSDGVPMITTVNDAEATTYLGDLSIGVFAGGADVGSGAGAPAHASDRFNALLWKAGRKSMVHISEIYAEDHGQPTYKTNGHSLIYITGNGGGRWYNVGARKAFVSDHLDFRMFRLKGTSQPLSIYGLDLEHGSGPRDYGLVENSSNIRIYGVKNEMHYPANPNDPVIIAYSAGSSVLTFKNSTNVGLFGVSALRNGLTAGKGLIQFFDCAQALATLLTPQEDDYIDYTGPTPPKPAGPIVLEKTSGSVTGSIAFPNIVSMYKEGEINDGDVVHGFDGDYGP